MSNASDLPSPTHREAFGERLRILRMAAGLSQEMLAEKAGLHRTYVSSVERGHRNVGLDNIYAIADAIDVQPSLLFGNDD